MMAALRYTLISYMLHKYVIFDELKNHAGFNDVSLLALITQKG